MQEENQEVKRRGRPKKEDDLSNTPNTQQDVAEEEVAKDDDLIAKLAAKIEQLEKKDTENQEKIKMLCDVADKGRVINYENKKTGKKTITIKLSEFAGGFIVGWRTVKDELIKHPQTGAVVGESQEYELMIINNDGQLDKKTVIGYSAFSSARYDNRVAVDILSKSEDYDGNISFEVKLPNGNPVKIDSRFVN